MSLLLYAIAGGAYPDPSRTAGLTGQPLRTVGAEGLAAIVGEAPAPLEASLDQLRAFAAIVDRLAGAGTILPARYGTVLADVAATRAALTRQAGSYLRRLARVHGAVEFGLRARDAGAVPAPATSPGGGAGTAYLMAKVAQRRRDDELAAVIANAVSPLIRARAERRDPRHGLAIACLVDARQVEPFLARVEALREELAPGSDLTCTGPWPPFSFSAEEAA